MYFNFFQTNILIASLQNESICKELFTRKNRRGLTRNDEFIIACVSLALICKYNILNEYDILQTKVKLVRKKTEDKAVKQYLGVKLEDQEC